MITPAGFAAAFAVAAGWEFTAVLVREFRAPVLDNSDPARDNGICIRPPASKPDTTVDAVIYRQEGVLIHSTISALLCTQNL